MSESALRQVCVSQPTSLEVKRIHQPDSLAMLAAFRVVLALPKQLPRLRQQDLLSDGQLSNRYTPDRTGQTSEEGSGREGTE